MTTTTYVWSDLHIGHRMIAEKWRPWAGGSVEAHDATIAERWTARVQPDDDVWILGDACMGTLADSLAVVGALPGRKHLVAGNHDRVSDAYLADNKSSAGQREKWTAMYGDVFDSIATSGVAVPMCWTGGMMLSHYPWSDTPDHVGGEGNERDLIARFGLHRDLYPGVTLLHGHLHSPDKRPVAGAIHVGVDAWQDGPIPLDELMAML